MTKAAGLLFSAFAVSGVVAQTVDRLPDILVTATLTNGVMTITNHNNYDWSDCLVLLNPDDETYPFDLEIPRLSAKSALLVRMESFGDPYGHHFRQKAARVAKLHVACMIPDGSVSAAEPLVR